MNTSISPYTKDCDPIDVLQAARLRTFLGASDDSYAVKTTMNPDQQHHVDLIVSAANLAEIEKLPFVLACIPALPSSWSQAPVAVSAGLHGLPSHIVKALLT